MLSVTIILLKLCFSQQLILGTKYLPLEFDGAICNDFENNKVWVYITNSKTFLSYSILKETRESPTKQKEAKVSYQLKFNKRYSKQVRLLTKLREWATTRIASFFHSILDRKRPKIKTSYGRDHEIVKCLQKGAAGLWLRPEVRHNTRSRKRRSDWRRFQHSYRNWTEPRKTAFSWPTQQKTSLAKKAQKAVPK